VHVDTTSWSLAGIYADSVAESEALHITCGFSKDNLYLIAEKGIKFISRLPATFKQEGMVKDRAWLMGAGKS